VSLLGLAAPGEGDATSAVGSSRRASASVWGVVAVAVVVAAIVIVSAAIVVVAIAVAAVVIVVTMAVAWVVLTSRAVAEWHTVVFVNWSAAAVVSDENFLGVNWAST